MAGVLAYKMSCMVSTNATSIDISKSAGITIVWSDGHRSEYDLQYLRDRCPCATCGSKTHRPAAAPAGGLTPLPMFKARPKIQDVETIGRYAIRLFWSDGHSTGIYSFDHLRAICPCPECHPAERPHALP